MTFHRRLMRISSRKEIKAVAARFAPTNYPIKIRFERKKVDITEPKYTKKCKVDAIATTSDKKREGGGKQYRS